MCFYLDRPNLQPADFQHLLINETLYCTAFSRHDSASLVCRAWRGSAQRLLRGHRKLLTARSAERFLQSVQCWPSSPCRSLSITLDAFADSKPEERKPFQQPITLSMIPYFYHLGPNLRELLIWSRIRRKCDPIDCLITAAAPSLRSLSLVHRILPETATQDGTAWIDFADFLIRIYQPILANTHLKHLTFSRVALSDTFTFETTLPDDLPCFAPRLNRLNLAACIISDSDFLWLCKSQIGW